MSEPSTNSKQFINRCYSSVTSRTIAVIANTTPTATRIASILQPRGMRIPQYGHRSILIGIGTPHSGQITVGSLFGLMSFGLATISISFCATKLNNYRSICNNSDGVSTIKSAPFSSNSVRGRNPHEQPTERTPAALAV